MGAYVSKRDQVTEKIMVLVDKYDYQKTHGEFSFEDESFRDLLKQDISAIIEEAQQAAYEDGIDSERFWSRVAGERKDE